MNHFICLSAIRRVALKLATPLGWFGFALVRYSPNALLSTLRCNHLLVMRETGLLSKYQHRLLPRALEWLLVAQSHNTDAQGWLKQDPNYTLYYAKTTYLKEALEFAGYTFVVGGPIPYAYIKGFLESFKRNHNPDRNPDHLRQRRQVDGPKEGGLGRG